MVTIKIIYIEQYNRILSITGKIDSTLPPSPFLTGSRGWGWEMRVYKRGYIQAHGQHQGVWCVEGNPVGSSLICHTYTAECSSSMSTERPENWITPIRSH